MAGETKAQMNALLTFLDAIPGIDSPRKGVPESVPNANTAFVAVGGRTPSDRMTQVNRIGQRFLITIARRVSGNESAQEDGIADFMDEFHTRFLAERKEGRLSGTCRGMTYQTLADQAEYQPFAAQEYRLYPILVELTRDEQI